MNPPFSEIGGRKGPVPGDLHGAGTNHDSEEATIFGAGQKLGIASIRFGLVLAALTTLSHIAFAEDMPLVLHADDLFISSDRTVIEAQGAVVAEFENVRLSADELGLRRESEGVWLIEASGDVHVALEGDLSLSGDRLTAAATAGDSGLLLATVEVAGFRGETLFTNSVEEEHTLYFRGETGQITFDEAGEASLIEVWDTEVTTCDCCELPFRSQPYTLHASRLKLYPDQLIAVFGLTVRIVGVPSFWLPVYVQPLGETLESPLFPAFGRSGQRGWYLKWNIPYYLNESLYGSLLLDYYTAFEELGVGLITRYAFVGHRGQFRVYNFPAEIGDSIFELSLQHQLPAGASWRGEGGFDYRIEGDKTELDYGAKAEASRNGWTIRASAEREIEEEQAGTEESDDTTRKVTERLPEISASREPWDGGLLFVHPTFAVGRYREVIGEDPAVEALRANAALQLRAAPWRIAGLTLSPRLNLQGTIYEGESIRQSRASMQTSIGASWRNLELQYDLVLVRGGSPFDFDAEVATHHIGWEIVHERRATLTVVGGIALNTGSHDPLRAQIEWTDWASWILAANYDLHGAALDVVRLSGNWSSEGVRVTWSIPYLPAEAGFGKIKLTADASGEWLNLDANATLDRGDLSVKTDLDVSLLLAPFEFTGNVAFSELTVSGVSLAAAFNTETGWGARVSGAFSGDPLSLDDVRYGLFWDIGGCLRVGIDREASDTWFYVSILAFPEAILRYAPESARVQAGS